MKKVGLLVGREKTFPLSLIERINERGEGEVVAEFVKVGGVRPIGRKSRLIIDRISHEVAFYRASHARRARRHDSHHNHSVVFRRQVSTIARRQLTGRRARTVLLRRRNNGSHERSSYESGIPLDGMASRYKVPAFKPFGGGGWRTVSKVNSSKSAGTSPTDRTRRHDLTGVVGGTVSAYCIGQPDG